MVGWGKGWCHDAPQVQGSRVEDVARRKQGLPLIAFGFDPCVRGSQLEGVLNDFLCNAMRKKGG